MLNPDLQPAVLVEQESELYQPVERYLHDDFYQQIRPRLGSLRLETGITANTVATGHGRWSRPDLAAVAISRWKYGVGAKLDLHTFEVKKSTPTDVTAVHEALAHRRFANFTYLVWNWPLGDTQNTKYREIIKSCETHGVGLIVVHDPGDSRFFELRLTAKRHEVPLDDVDDFIENRFTEEGKARVIEALKWRDKI